MQTQWICISLFIYHNLVDIVSTREEVNERMLSIFANIPVFLPWMQTLINFCAFRFPCHMRAVKNAIACTEILLSGFDMWSMTYSCAPRGCMKMSRFWRGSTTSLTKLKENSDWLHIYSESRQGFEVIMFVQQWIMFRLDSSFPLLFFFTLNLWKLANGSRLHCTSHCKNFHVSG